MKIKAIGFALSILLIISLTSCNSPHSNYILKTSISGNPYTLDPQRAEYDSSYSVIYNVFQGLFTYDIDGKIQNGMIEEYNVSDDGFIWTFNLKQNVIWSDGKEFTAECTADDFVFAFERLFRPETKARNADEYYVIKNSENINKGSITDLSELGVKAIDKYILEITLEKKCTHFMELLTLPPAMPCNREYYESTEGRYGLSADCVASNGNYYVHTWSYDKWSDENNYFILRRNPESADFDLLPLGINLFIDAIDEKKNFDDGIFQVYSGKSYEEISELKKKYRFSYCEKEIWGIIFNQNSEFSDLNYRLALSDYINYNGSNDIYTATNAIIPHSVSLGERSYREIAGDIPTNSQTTIDSDVGILSSLNMRMIMPAGTELRGNIGEILQNWQAECNFYCSISEMDKVDYDEALSNGNFDIALVRLSDEYNSPYAYLNDFIYGNAQNYSNYKNRKFEHIMSSAFEASDYEIAAKYYYEAEQLLIESAVFVPLCTKKEYIFYSDELTAVKYNPYSDVYEVKNN